MHELALSQQLAGIVARAAAGRRVCSVQVQVGHLRQVVPDALHHAWTFTVRTTELDGAALVIDEVPVRLHCLDCDQTSEPGERLGFDCLHCQSPRTRVVAGEEFLVTSIDVDEAPPQRKDP